VSAKAKALAVLLVALPQPGLAQLSGGPASAGCVSVSGNSPRATAEGHLTLQLFPGPPNYDSIAAGDTEERTFILKLPRRDCIDDGSDFADPSERLVTVHVSAASDSLMAVLRDSIGRQVAVSGEAFAAHTGHHHAPLVVVADSVVAR